MNIAQVLKSEITRLAKKEAKALNNPTKATTIQLKKTVATLKAQVATLEKSNAILQKHVEDLIASQPKPQEETEVKGWISGKGVKSLRKKLNVTQGELAKLVGVSMSAVVQWEAKKSMLKLRKDTLKALMAVRGIGAREARKRLEG